MFFSICDNSSLGLNGLVKDKFVSDDGYHLSSMVSKYWLLICGNHWNRF